MTHVHGASRTTAPPNLNAVRHYRVLSDDRPEWWLKDLGATLSPKCIRNPEAAGIRWQPEPMPTGRHAGEGHQRVCNGMQELQPDA